MPASQDTEAPVIKQVTMIIRLHEDGTNSAMVWSHSSVPMRDEDIASALRTMASALEAGVVEHRAVSH